MCLSWPGSSPSRWLRVSTVLWRMPWDTTTVPRLAWSSSAKLPRSSTKRHAVRYATAEKWGPARGVLTSCVTWMLAGRARLCLPLPPDRSHRPRYSQVVPGHRGDRTRCVGRYHRTPSAGAHGSTLRLNGHCTDGYPTSIPVPTPHSSGSLPVLRPACAPPPSASGRCGPTTGVLARLDSDLPARST